MENNNYRSSNNGKLNGANQAEILRSHQKDGEFVNLLYQQLNDLLVRFGIKKPFGFLQSDTAAKLIYFIFTSGIGNQTLGEEYTGIVQAHLKERKIPSLTVCFHFQFCIHHTCKNSIEMFYVSAEGDIGDPRMFWRTNAVEAFRKAAAQDQSSAK